MIVYIQINENTIYLSVPFIDAQPIAIVPTGLPFDIDITVPYFGGIRPRDYNLFDEVLRQSDILDENEKIKWIIRWLHGEDPNQW